YLIFCALGAGLLNWALFSGMMKTMLGQLTQAEEAIRQLGRQLSEKSAAQALDTAMARPGGVSEPPPLEPIGPVAMLNLDFVDLSADGSSAGPSMASAESLSDLHKIVRSALRALDGKI